MIRVLHVVTNMDVGGIETMLMNYYRHVDRSQLQFDFLVHRSARGAYDDEIESLGGRIYRLPRLNPFGVNYRQKLQKFFLEHSDYKIVHSHLDCMSAIPLKAAKKAGIPVRIAHAHSSNQDKNLRLILKQIYKHFIAHQATELFACSAEAGRWMFGAAEFSVFSNAIDARKYIYSPAIREEVREELGINAPCVIGHVGRFSAVKNQKFLIEILASMKKKGKNAQLLCVGQGTTMEAVQKHAKELGVADSIVFPGVRGDVNRMMQAMDVFVMPSLYEGLPLVLVEAQAAGLPCVISDKVPIECDKTGLMKQVALSAAADAWAEEIERARAQGDRRNRLAEIQAAGFDVVKNTEWLEAYYQAVAGGAHGNNQEAI